MEKYVTNLRDFVIEAMTNESQIQYMANIDKPEGNFMMGMIHLLGINTPVDFKKASLYFGNKSLSDDPDANSLLGFIAECEGNFSEAFQNYAKTESSDKDSYLVKVFKGRNNAQSYLKKLDLPTTLNKEISSLFSEYSKGKASKVGACIKIAAVCNDEPSCFEAAQALYDSKDYISAIQWLKKGGFGYENPLYSAINERFERAKQNLLQSNELQSIELDDNSLLSIVNPTPYLNKVMESCEKVSTACKKDWYQLIKKQIGKIIKEQKDKEHKAFLKEQAERKKKREDMIKYCVIGAVVLFFISLGFSIKNSLSSSYKDNQSISETIINGNKKLYGVVDEYPITMELQIEDSKVNGSLYYNKYGPENILILSGIVNKNTIDLDESEKKGKQTGHFSGSYSNGVFQGEYTKSTGKSMPFKVSEQQ